jgi:4-hydroxy-L-threonine phosphate dehydrogenase PdxA
MYHDQGLPVSTKALVAVNDVSLPDYPPHLGRSRTVLDLAGSGQVDSGSLLVANRLPNGRQPGE